MKAPDSIDQADRLAINVLADMAIDYERGSAAHDALHHAIEALHDRIETRARIALLYQRAGAAVGDNPWP